MPTRLRDTIQPYCRSSIYFGTAKDARALYICSNIALIRTVRSQMDAIEEEMLVLFNAEQTPKEEQDVMAELIDNLRTIPGVADKSILALLAECGNLDRFHDARALVGYMGIYPTLEQSGDTRKNGKLAKRGARLAKKAIFLAAVAAIRHNEQLRTVYNNYRSRGRAKKECIIIVARKLVHIIYAIYTRNIPYDPKRVFIAKPNQ